MRVSEALQPHIRFYNLVTLKMDPSLVDVPSVKDLTIDNITENVHLINSRCPDPRLKYIMERLVSHVHDFARETRLSTNEWMTGLNFLKAVGQISSDVRQVSIVYIELPSKSGADRPAQGIHPAL